MMWIGIIFLCVLRCVESNTDELSREILAQKCCAHGEYLLFDNKGVGTCTRLEGVTVTKEKYERVDDILNRDPAEPTDFEWLPHDFRTTETNKMWVKYSQKDLCPRKQALFISSSDKHFYRIGQKGSLIFMAGTTGGQIVEIPFSNREYCIDKSRGLKSPHVFMICPCERMRCIPKCCANEWVLRFRGSDPECKLVRDSKGKPLTNNLKLAEETTYAVLDGQLPKCEYRVGHKEEMNWPHNYVRSWFSTSKGRVFEDKDACIDFLWHDAAPLTHTVASCSRTPEVKVFLSRRAALHIISTLLLGISIVALVHHKVRCSVHLLSLGSYFFSLFFYHILLVSTMWLEEPLFPCSTIGSFMYYFTLSSATWLSIASFNIALNSRKLINALPEDQRARYERILCCFYSLYAWGVPASFLAFTYSVRGPPEIPQDTPLPTVSVTRSCPDVAGNVVKSDMFIYFSAPLTLMLIFVTLLFTTTAVQMRLLRERTFILQRPENPTDTGFYVKWRTIIYLKLMLMVMMLEFALELIEWASTDTSSYVFEIITDFLDLMRAATIFTYWGSRFFWKIIQLVWGLPEVSASQQPPEGESAQQIEAVTPQDVPDSSQPQRSQAVGDAALTSGSATSVSTLRNPLAVMQSGWWSWFPYPMRRAPLGSTVPLTEAVAPTAGPSRLQIPPPPLPVRRASQLSISSSQTVSSHTVSSHIPITPPHAEPSHHSITPTQAGPSHLSITPTQAGPSHISTTPPQAEPSHISTTPPQSEPSPLSTTPPPAEPSQQPSTPPSGLSPSQTSPSPSGSSFNRRSPSRINIRRGSSSRASAGSSSPSPMSTPSASPTPTRLSLQMVSLHPGGATADFIAHEKESSM